MIFLPLQKNEGDRPLCVDGESRPLASMWPGFGLYAAQLVTPSEVARAVRTLTITCKMVFHVSFFILVNV